VDIEMAALHSANPICQDIPIHTHIHACRTEREGDRCPALEGDGDTERALHKGLLADNGAYLGGDNAGIKP